MSSIIDAAKFMFFCVIRKCFTMFLRKNFSFLRFFIQKEAFLMVFFEQMCGLGAEANGERRRRETQSKMQINLHFRSAHPIFNPPSGAFR